MKKILSLVTLVAMISSLLIIPANAVAPYSDTVPNYVITAEGNSAITTAPNTYKNLVNDNYSDNTKYATTDKISSWMVKTVVADGDFKMEADTAQPAQSTNNAAFVTALPYHFQGQRLRADSVDFQIPVKVEGATDEEYAAGYIRLFDSDSANTNAYVYGNAENALKIQNGGAYTQDMNKYTDKKWKNQFIAEGTLVAGNWYRAERILDVRDEDKLVDGAIVKGSNWQRFVIYDSNDTVVGDSGWVKTSDRSINCKSTTALYGDSEIGYPLRGTGYGAWGYPAGTSFLFDNIKCWNLDEPQSADFSTEGAELNKFVKWPVGATATNSRCPYFGYSLNWNDDTVRANLVPASYTDIYYGADFMLPELNTNALSLLDFCTSAMYPTSASDRATGPIQIAAGGVLTITEYDSASTAYTNAVNASGSDAALSVQLEAGKWYTAKHHITIDADTSTATAVTTITDEEGNIYTTDSYSFKNDKRELVRLLATAAPSSNRPYTGVDICLDNVKLSFALGEENSESAVVVIDEDYTKWAEGTDFYTEIAHENVSASYKNKVLTMQNGMVVSDKNVTFADVPGSVQLTFVNPMNETALEGGAVKLYQAGAEVTGGTVDYDSATKTLTINKNLSPQSEYTLTIDRSAATPANTVLSALPGEKGDVLTYTIKTGAETQKDLEFMVEFKDGSNYLDGAALKANQTVSFEAYCSNPNSTIPVDYALIVAAYSVDGELEDISSVTGTAAVNAVYSSVNVDSVTTETAGGYIKVFVWDSWGTMSPVGNISVYPPVQ